MHTTRSLRTACAVGAVVLLAACGTRRSDGEFRDAAGLSPAGEVAAAGPAPEVSPGATPSAASEATGVAPPADAGSTGSPGGATPQGVNGGASVTATTARGTARPSAGQASPGASQTGTAAPKSAAAGGGPATGGSGAANAPGPTPGGAAPGPGAGSGKAPVIIGNVGSYSGPIGSSLKSVAEGVQVWTKYINERGGLNGHPVQLIVADDGGDQAKHRSLVQQLVETQKVIVFLGQAAVFTGASTVDYLTSKKIPVIGNDQGSDWFYNSPVFFTQAPTGITYWESVVGSTADWARANKKTKWATVACTEATTCADGDKVFHESGLAQKLGLQPVYRGRVSLAQPDFTAECLNAQRAGAEIFTLLVDAATTQRVAASCARQGYRPLFGAVGTSIKTEYAADPNMGDNALAAVGTFIWTDGSTPQTAEFQSVMRRILGRAPGNGNALAWVSGKM
ncbi:MAG TPA: ABC transporter substrate-binding protein, partial [Acidimicrobiia bacterium]|nr:ABC transporter substrate-binding protein [Acidimicrobiia bacterium]